MHEKIDCRLREKERERRGASRASRIELRRCEIGAGNRGVRSQKGIRRKRRGTSREKEKQEARAS